MANTDTISVSAPYQFYRSYTHLTLVDRGCQTDPPPSPVSKTTAYTEPRTTPVLPRSAILHEPSRKLTSGSVGGVHSVGFHGSVPRSDSGDSAGGVSITRIGQFCIRDLRHLWTEVERKSCSVNNVNNSAISMAPNIANRSTFPDVTARAGEVTARAGDGCSTLAIGQHKASTGEAAERDALFSRVPLEVVDNINSGIDASSSQALSGQKKFGQQRASPGSSVQAVSMPAKSS